MAKEKMPTWNYHKNKKFLIAAGKSLAKQMISDKL